MSLDVGIQVMRTPEVEQIPELAAFDNPWSKKYNFDILICNWKNCYGIRSGILDVINSNTRFDAKNRLVLSIEDIDGIIIFLEALNESMWHNLGGGVRTFEEIEIPLKEDVVRLQTIKRLMTEHDLMVYFYELF